MTTTKLVIFSLDEFITTGAAEIAGTDGRITLNNISGNNFRIAVRFSLPRSTTAGLGSNLQSLALNYLINTGSAASFTPSLSREIYENGSILSSTNIPFGVISPAFGLTQNANGYKPVMPIATPAYDNQAAAQTVLYYFTLDVRMNVNPFEYLYPAQIIIGGLEINYLYNPGGGVPVQPPPSTSTTLVHVNKGGNDGTADGSILLPYLTISAAITAIVDATPTKRYSIQLGPGTYTEAITLKANIFIDGVGEANLAQINGTINVNHASWNAAGDHRSGFSKCSLIGAASTINMATQSSPDGKFYLDRCLVTNNLSFTAFNNNNAAVISNTNFLSGTLAQTGFNIQLHGVSLLSGTGQTLTVASAAGLNAVLLISHSSGNNNISATQPVGGGTITLTVIGYSKTAGTISLDGVGVSAAVTSSSIGSAPTLANGATVTYGNTAAGLGYVPAIIGSWNNVQPVTVQSALDRVAAYLITKAPAGPIP
jgi:hypothetical protein